MRLSNRRRTAWSRLYGMLVAPSTSTRLSPLPTPCICTRNSVLMRRAASLSPESPRALHRESISSMKTIDGARSLARPNSWLTSFSLSPIHLETRSDEETLKNVDSASVAMALARYDFPVPGGPYRRIPDHGFRAPVKNCGNWIGRMTASFSASFAPSRPATSSHLMLGFSSRMTPPRLFFSFMRSASSASSSPCPLGLAFVAVEPTPFAWLLDWLSMSSSMCLMASARCKYSLNFTVMTSFDFGFLSYFRCALKWSKAFRYSSYAIS
mmetsp:Transcript_42952/g.101992  ORF Transcript_42952/g.101992 Transcript_42952/m.101992 type:complete len:268 (+) Transcript_42952:698-1501(+)